MGGGEGARRERRGDEGLGEKGGGHGGRRRYWGRGMEGEEEGGMVKGGSELTFI